MKHHFVIYAYKCGAWNWCWDGGYTATCVHCAMYKTTFYTRAENPYSGINYWIDSDSNEYANFQFMFGYIPDCEEVIKIKRKLILRDIIE